MRLYIMPGLPTHLVQEITAGTVAVHISVHGQITSQPALIGLRSRELPLTSQCVSLLRATAKFSEAVPLTACYISPLQGHSPSAGAGPCKVMIAYN